METHLADHCNLNCKGCGHYCPITPPHFTDLRQYESDLQRLRELFGNIRMIRLMGGEPLLHEDAASFITVTRTAFPRSDLRFVTNGILLPKASPRFWDACRSTKTIIDLTAYPPFRHRVECWRALCEAQRVRLRVTSVETFFAFHNLRGDSDKQKAFKLCRRRWYCPFLREGRLYVCSVPALVHTFNKRFGTKIRTDRGIDIHSQGINGGWILRQLNRPIETCSWCSCDIVPFPWSVSNKLPAEWDAGEQRKTAE